MTTPPKYCQLVGKVAVLSGSYDRPARALGRQRMVYVGAGNYSIIPTAETWPYATDWNGIAYPAGTVGVRQEWAPSADFTMIPVPSVLPAGYTNRWTREFYYRPGSSSPTYGQAYCNPFAHQNLMMRFPTGLRDYWYTPELRGNDYIAGVVAYYNGILGTPYGWTQATVGLRYIQWSVDWPGYYAGPAGYPGDNLVIELRCNADGSSGGAGPGDTLLATWTATNTPGPSTSTSPLITTGLDFALGVKKCLQYKVTANFTGGYTTWPVNVISGPRVDIPLPWTSTGKSGLIAPGGYVASALDVPLPT